jgi:hypothetical protein
VSSLLYPTQSRCFSLIELNAWQIRIRRVKCDEGKPICQKCIDFGVGCDGYDALASPVKSVKIPTEVVNYRPLLPRRGDYSKVLISQPLHSLHFRNEEEQRYFQIFQNDTGPELSGGFNSSLWNQIILQACHEEPFVRDAIIAIAALNKSIGPTPVATDDGSFQDLACRHYEFALQQYGKALRVMRATITSDEHLRKALIACLLIFCFEGFQGNQDAAIKHVQSGYKLLQDRKGMIAASQEPVTPMSAVIEEDIIRTFERLDLQVMTVLDSRPLELHMLAKNEGNEWVEQMPAVFRDLEEAHMYWEIVMRRSAHFIYSAAIPCREPDKNIQRGNERKLGVHLGCVIHISFPPDPASDMLRREHARYASEVMRWQSAFKLLRYCSYGLQKMAASLLQIHAQAVQIVLDSLIMTEECSFDKYLPQYREMIFLAKAYYKTSSKSPQEHTVFSVDFGVLPAIYTVIKHCRHPAIRREAIALLRSSPRREGIWQSSLVAEIGEWMMTLEEEDMSENGYIPEYSRVRIVRTIVNAQKRTAWVECAKRVKGKDGGGLVYRNTTVNW